ncbi:hypothetical protein Hdeb2414_s0008g00266191 [Helianthus debilis subsp. tardiflorus]
MEKNNACFVVFFLVICASFSNAAEKPIDGSPLPSPPPEPLPKICKESGFTAFSQDLKPSLCTVVRCYKVCEQQQIKHSSLTLTLSGCDEGTRCTCCMARDETSSSLRVSGWPLALTLLINLVYFLI